MNSERLDAIAASARISEHYERYLRSTFQLADQQLQGEMERAFNGLSPLVKGPFLQTVPPFALGKSVRALVEDDVLHRDFLVVPPDVLPPDRPLYIHQEQAIRKSVTDRRNLLVATGTGSGKTEAFLFPIINHLLGERKKNALGPGVRALLLYPMNALANDQVRRIRQLLGSFPDITFGRYVGDTPQQLRQAEGEFSALFPGEPRLANEFISREQMQSEPPHILLTNFSMLEYLLLRTADLRLFAQTPVTWKYLVLDEAHVYGGAKGTEVAMLLRRVKERVFGSTVERGGLQCVATSATLGGPDDHARMSEFATNLFGERFSWDLVDPRSQDVVTATRVLGADAAPTTSLPEDAYGRMLEVLDTPQMQMDAMTEALQAIAGPRVGFDGDGLRLTAQVLLSDRRFVSFRSDLEKAEVVDPRLLAERHFPTLRMAGVSAIVSLGARARLTNGAAPVLPARYHLLLRALDGAYACLDAEHPRGTNRIVLEAHTRCPACAQTHRSHDTKMFELAACRNCGAAHVVGVLQPYGDQRVLVQASPANVARHWFLLADNAQGTSEEDDEDADSPPLGPGRHDVEHKLCTRCGDVSSSAAAACRCKNAERRLVVQLATDDEEGRIMKCRRCGGRHPAGAIARFESGADAPLTVIATDLYQSLPRDRSLAVYVPGEGRKLISFADSRQDAAYFASFFERTYNRGLRRSSIVRGLRALAEEQGGRTVALRDAAGAIARIATRDGLMPHDGVAGDGERAASAWLLSEALNPDQRIGLEGSGLLRISAFDASLGVPPALLKAGFSTEQSTALLQVLIDVFRRKGAVAIPLGVSVDALEIAGVVTAMRSEVSSKGVMAWVPSPKRTNRQKEYVERVVTKLGLQVNAEVILRGTWDYLGQTKVLIEEIAKRDGAVRRLSHGALRFELADSLARWRCSTCQRIAYHNVGDVCATYRCVGTLKAVPATAIGGDGHYAALYRELAPIPANVEEHTAQLETKTGARIQQEFTKGVVNVLSCSTTFELGVDVGEVQAVLMRNVPPSPANYVQRAGRAGRRADGAALVVTYAQKRNHDRYHFSQPLLLLRGVVRPPNIKMENAKIVRRHLHSVAFALFERAHNRRDSTVEDFFLAPAGQTGSTHEAFITWLKERPPALLASLRGVLADIPAVGEALGVEQWQWADDLVDANSVGAEAGWLTRAATAVADDVSTIQAALDEQLAAKRYKPADALNRLLNTIKGRELLGYLGSKSVLPKYGFPADVVEFNLRTPDAAGDPVVSTLDLTRDLQIAISEYAPGGQVMAGKRLWEGVGVKLIKDKGLLEHAWMLCENCRGFNDALGEASKKTVCPVCSTAVSGSGNSGMFVIPVFGFVGSSVSQQVTDARPKRAGFAEAFFSDYSGGSPEPTRLRCAPHAAPIEIRTSQNGRITVLNRGPKGRGFQLCAMCGYVGAVASRAKTPRDHPIPGNSARRCTGTLKLRSLGHYFLTDVLEIAPDITMTFAQANSALQALVVGATSLGIPSDDIGGVIHAGGNGRAGFVLYDTVPGGAGHVTSVANQVTELLKAASIRVSGCDCGVDSSCYGCLRSYRNQRYHDQLTRRDALAIMHQLLGV